MVADSGGAARMSAVKGSDPIILGESREGKGRYLLLPMLQHSWLKQWEGREESLPQVAVAIGCNPRWRILIVKTSKSSWIGGDRED